MGRFNIIESKIKDVKIIEAQPFLDNRGYFYESYNKNDFIKMGITEEFVQDNQSMSSKGVIRGLHFQINYPQAKLVRCIKGEVFDICVDLRKDSKTFGQYEGVILSEDNYKMFYIPKGFAHGFVVLSETAVFSYKVTDFYHANDEGGIIWNDKDINIKWPFLDDPNFKLSFSDKDQKWPTLNEYINTRK